MDLQSSSWGTEKKKKRRWRTRRVSLLAFPRATAFSEKKLILFQSKSILYRFDIFYWPHANISCWQSPVQCCFDSKEVLVAGSEYVVLYWFYSVKILHCWIMVKYFVMQTFLLWCWSVSPERLVACVDSWPVSDDGSYAGGVGGFMYVQWFLTVTWFSFNFHLRKQGRHGKDPCMFCPIPQ